MNDAQRDDVRAVLAGLEEAALGYAAEYGHQFGCVGDAVKWVLAADADESSDEERAQFAAYLRLKEAVQP